MRTLQENFLSQGTHSKVCPPCLFFMCVVICFFYVSVKFKSCLHMLEKFERIFVVTCMGPPLQIVQKTFPSALGGSSTSSPAMFTSMSPQMFSWNVHLGCSPPPECPRSSRPSQPRQVRRGRGHRLPLQSPPPPQLVALTLQNF